MKSIIPNIKTLFAFVVVQLLIFSNLYAQQKTLVFKGDNQVIGQYVSILEDPTNKMDITSALKSTGYVSSSIQTPNLPLSKSAYWMKFSLKNESEFKTLLMEVQYPNFDICELYALTANGHYLQQQLSARNTFAQRKYKHQNFLFDVVTQPGTTSTFYLKVRSSEQMVLPIILGTQQKVAESMLTRDLLWGILIGLILVMIFYNLFVYISTRDKSYLYYVLYITFIGLTQTSLSGYTYRYMFFNSPDFYHKSLIIFPGLAGIFAVLFVRAFLHTNQNTPNLNKVLNVPMLLYVLAIILRVVGIDELSYRMIDVAALCVTVVIVTIAVKISRQGYRPAQLFLLAWTMFLTGLVLFVLRNLGILPHNNFTNYTMQAGTAFEVTLLSLALADRINTLKREKEQSQAEALRSAQENERIIREQNVILERKVAERTAALKESNEELNTTLEDLKQTQSQLVDSEKMASLGQLTAGIAHEINNPINFVTSNVTPLKRDVSILFDVVSVFENTALADIPQEIKRKQLAEYKEEIDFDYLKIEIEHLLKGIYEGSSRTAEIVKGLRIFSRVDEDDLKRADINEGLDSTLIIVNNLLNNRITITKDYAELPLIECYPGKLNQVFLNIITNGIYAINKRHGEASTGEFQISTYLEGDSVFVKLKDNGTGMDDNTRRKIFEPFFTTKEVGEGTGLGMSIAYNTIKKHNGHIYLNSTLGVGTEFIIELPVLHKIIATL